MVVSSYITPKALIRAYPAGSQVRHLLLVLSSAPARPPAGPPSLSQASPANGCHARDREEAYRRPGRRGFRPGSGCPCRGAAMSCCQDRVRADRLWRQVGGGLPGADAGQKRMESAAPRPANEPRHRHRGERPRPSTSRAGDQIQDRDRTVAARTPSRRGYGPLRTCRWGERVLVEISVPPPTSFPGENGAEVVARRNRSSCTSSRFTIRSPPLTAAPIRRRALSAWSRTWSGPRRRETSGSPPGSGSPSCPGP
jgi:hypothetical protein